MAKSAYGHIKQTQIIGCLSTDEQDEFEWLSDRKRLTKTQSDRMGVLWEKAEALHADRMAARQQEYADREERIRQYEQQGR